MCSMDLFPQLPCSEKRVRCLTSKLLPFYPSTDATPAFPDCVFSFRDFYASSSSLQCFSPAALKKLDTYAIPVKNGGGLEKMKIKLELFFLQDISRESITLVVKIREKKKDCYLSLRFFFFSFLRPNIF